MGSYISAIEEWSVCQTESWSLIGYNPSQPITNKITKMMQIFVVTLLLSRMEGSPVLVELQSQYPANPIEDPPTWAWGQHPQNGLGYKAKDNLEVEVCLANPHYINTAKCKLPLEVCLDNPQYLSSLGCSDALQGYQPTLFQCQDNKEQLCSLKLCEKHEFIVKCNG